MSIPQPTQASQYRRVLYTDRLYAIFDKDVNGLQTAIILRPFGFFVRTGDDGDLPMTQTIDLSSIKDSELGRIGAYVHVIRFKIDDDEIIRSVDVEPITTAKAKLVDGVFLSHLIPLEIGE